MARVVTNLLGRVHVGGPPRQGGIGGDGLRAAFGPDQVLVGASPCSGRRDPAGGSQGDLVGARWM